MNQHPDTHPAHRQVVAAALEDWWLTTDPREPFHAPDVADHVETYLLSSGYTITPDAPAPSWAAIAFNTALALVAALAAVVFLHDRIWLWAIACIALAAGLAREIHLDITDRHHHDPRNA